MGVLTQRAALWEPHEATSTAGQHSAMLLSATYVGTCYFLKVFPSLLSKESKTVKYCVRVSFKNRNSTPGDIKSV